MSDEIIKDLVRRLNLTVKSKFETIEIDGTVHAICPNCIKILKKFEDVCPRCGQHILWED